MRDFIITKAHKESEDFHQWYWPGQWRPEEGIENRDRGGRAAGTRKGMFPAWFVLACNNSDCDGRAAVPVQFLTDFADSKDGWVR